MVDNVGLHIGELLENEAGGSGPSSDGEQASVSEVVLLDESKLGG